MLPSGVRSRRSVHATTSLDDRFANLRFGKERSAAEACDGCPSRNLRSPVLHHLGIVPVPEQLRLEFFEICDESPLDGYRTPLTSRHSRNVRAIHAALLCDSGVHVAEEFSAFDD